MQGGTSKKSISISPNTTLHGSLSLDLHRHLQLSKAANQTQKAEAKPYQELSPRPLLQARSTRAYIPCAHRVRTAQNAYAYLITNSS